MPGERRSVEGGVAVRDNGVWPVEGLVLGLLDVVVVAAAVAGLSLPAARLGEAVGAGGPWLGVAESVSCMQCWLDTRTVCAIML